MIKPNWKNKGPRKVRAGAGRSSVISLANKSTRAEVEKGGENFPVGAQSQFSAMGP